MNDKLLDPDWVIDAAWSLAVEEPRPNIEDGADTRKDTAKQLRRFAKLLETSPAKIPALVFIAGLKTGDDTKPLQMTYAASGTMPGVVAAYLTLAFTGHCHEYVDQLQPVLEKLADETDKDIDVVAAAKNLHPVYN
jgi:hypothetical protein